MIQPFPVVSSLPNNKEQSAFVCYLNRFSSSPPTLSQRDTVAQCHGVHALHRRQQHDNMACGGFLLIGAHTQVVESADLQSGLEVGYYQLGLL